MQTCLLTSRDLRPSEETCVLRGEMFRWDEGTSSHTSTDRRLH